MPALEGAGLRSVSREAVSTGGWRLLLWSVARGQAIRVKATRCYSAVTGLLCTSP